METSPATLFDAWFAGESYLRLLRFEHLAGGLPGKMLDQLRQCLVPRGRASWQARYSAAGLRSRPVGTPVLGNVVAHRPHLLSRVLALSPIRSPGGLNFSPVARGSSRK